MLLRSASTPIPNYPQSLTGLDGAGSLFQNRPISMTASPIKKIERTASDSNLKLLTIPGRKNFCTSPMGSPVSVKEDGMGVFATTKEPTSSGGENVGSEGFSTGGDGSGDSGRGRDSLEEYYQMMIETYPGDCVLLANYAKYLKEVQGDLLQAEEYCERALVNGNGDILSMYAELIWSNHKDAARAKAYFEQATKASPNDCHVHAAFARFLWDAGVEEEEEEEEEEEDEEENEFQFPTLTAFPQTQFSHEHPVTAAS